MRLLGRSSFLLGIQLHHLTPNSILHITIFVQLCEAFLGILPHFDLFKSLFSLNSFPNLRNIARVRGADLQFPPSTAEKYIPYTLRRQIGDWKVERFYVDNHAPALLKGFLDLRVSGSVVCWC